MPRRQTPSYRLHKRSGQAIVVLSGKMIYLGPYGSKASRKLYDQKISEWLARGRRLTPQAGTSISVVELCAAYLVFAKTYYQKNGTATGELGPVLSVISVLKQLYGKRPVSEFSPLKLKAAREHMIAKGWARNTINKQVKRIVRMFAWGVENELVESSIPSALREVRGLEAGRSAARECSPILPVEAKTVEATLPHLSPVVADMVRLQRLTGMRPNEVCILRPFDLERSGDVWRYRPSSHKTEHHGRKRVIFIGPQGQAILRPYLLRSADSVCFSPLESEQKRRAIQNAARKTAANAGNTIGSNRVSRPRWKPGDKYSTNTYRKAIWRACDKAFPVPENITEAEGVVWIQSNRWAPNQLRHAAATEIRKLFGLEAAQVTLGHAGADITQTYAERDWNRAAEVAKQIG